MNMPIQSKKNPFFKERVKRSLPIIWLLIFIHPSFGQTSKDTLYAIWENSKKPDSTRAIAFNILISKKYLDNKTDSAYILIDQLIKFTEANKIEPQQAKALITLGHINHILGDYPSATNSYEKSLKLYKKLGNKKGEAKALDNIGKMHKTSWNLDEALFFYEQSLTISKSRKDTLTIISNLTNIGNIYNIRFKADKALAYFNESLKLCSLKKDLKNRAVNHVNIGQSYIIKKDYKLAKKKTNEAIRIGHLLNNYSILAHGYSTMAQNYFKQKKHDSLIKIAKKSLFYAEKIPNKTKIRGAHYFLFEGYRGKKNFDSTFYHYEKGREYRNEAEDKANTRALQKMQIDNFRKTDSLMHFQKQLQNELYHQTEIQLKNKEKTNLTLAWGSSFSIVSLFAFLIFKNSKRKQLKAEKERQEQIEEKEKILKDLELSTIDAMIRGQEKERQKLASDLHDSVGATLSAAKMQFEYLIKNQTDLKASEELIKKTSTLLEDAYVEIRSMAHLKSSGVMAKNGLLPAIEKLSINASGINGLTFEVHSFGLKNRLENSLEISIFRIIQELITNIIKHAHATKGIVHLTNHEEGLNIIVEDNGIGFNTKNLKQASGMGIDSIDKRVEHLEGQMIIESKKDQGTTIIIDIPI
ncbi:tetratricopeptide repeat protein [Lacinutrix sp. WUR7]|uniref:tetratricopeptide repeat-containing sensor histidine kinase n=1 Tax=Lacinutrix sp. WUR7 TaxID=2653681 RepID=UPI00193DB042|nr:sensor histidine kinase [Lacinutrix sp. WUR7]QRM89635.1 tetratricopeptide repeat protein [Lacinutrix sp. WUR7]